MDNNFVMIITRTGHPGFERAVLVEHGVNYWRINPQFEVSLATRGEPPLSRDGCVLSFMEGLMAAGHQVLVRERRKNKRWSDYLLRQALFEANYPCFLFGLAWARAQWWPMRAQLERTIVSSQRLAVLTATGMYYFERPGEPSLALRVPI